MSDTPRILGGRYEVGELIGRGGMAEVHAGHDTRLGRTVAIKILRSDLARDPSFIHRFRREAQASAGLNHANIVAVYDSGEDTFIESGGGKVDIPYIVMEYVDGQTVRELLDEERILDGDEACRIMMGVLSALEYSHSKGIVHRDIKPGNVMVTRGGSVKVMDFGIARALADVAATMTSAQAVVGTARYLSPEQAQGQSVDPRADLYSAGCVLFEMLAGRAPFVGEPVSLVYQHIGEQPQPPSLYEHTVTPALDAVVLHSLEKDRGKRYQTAGEFRADVLAARSGQPVSDEAQASALVSADHTQVVDYSPAGASPPDHTAEMSERETKRSPVALWVLAGVVALAAILGIGYLVNRSSSKPSEATVTSVIGMTYDQANQTLSPSFKVTKKEVAAQQSEGTVIKQDPSGGTKAPLRSTVTLSVSSGPDSIQVPDVAGDSIADAKSALASAGIDASRIKVSTSERDDSGVDAGKIAATDPKSGSMLGSSDSVTLYPSSGRSTVPNVIGQSQNDATQALYKAHLSSDVQTQQTTDADKIGKVISEPQAGQKVSNGSQVVIVVGSAAPSTVTAPPAPASTTEPTTSTPVPTASSTSVPTSTPTTTATQSPTTSDTAPTTSQSTSSSDTGSVTGSRSTRSAMTGTAVGIVGTSGQVAAPN